MKLHVVFGSTAATRELENCSHSAASATGRSGLAHVSVACTMLKFEWPSRDGSGWCHHGAAGGGGSGDGDGGGGVGGGGEGGGGAHAFHIRSVASAA